MPDQPRNPKGSASGGQWRPEVRGGAAANVTRPKPDESVHSERFHPPAPGGFDELRVDPDGTTSYLSDGKLHRSDGAALIPSGNPVGSYYLHGEEVDQYDVFRLMAPDPEAFDHGYETGLRQTFDVAESSIGDFLRLGAIISNTMQLRPNDDYMRQAPDLAAIGCGSADAATALRSELSRRYRQFPAADPVTNAKEAIRSVRSQTGGA